MKANNNYDDDSPMIDNIAGILFVSIILAFIVGIATDSLLLGVIVIVIGLIIIIKRTPKTNNEFDPYGSMPASSDAVQLIINNGSSGDDDEDEDEDEEDEIEYVTKIAGVTFNNDESDVGGFLGYVRSDPNNPHDPDAIAIYRTDNKLVGYIPRDEQGEYRSWSAKENLPCIGFIAEGDEVDLYGQVKIVDADKSTTTLELVKYAAWLISNFGVKFAPRGLKITGTTNLRTKDQWLSALYKYIDKCER